MCAQRAAHVSIARNPLGLYAPAVMVANVGGYVLKDRMKIWGQRWVITLCSAAVSWACSCRQHMCICGQLQCWPCNALSGRANMLIGPGCSARCWRSLTAQSLDSVLDRRLYPLQLSCPSGGCPEASCGWCPFSWLHSDWGHAGTSLQWLKRWAGTFLTGLQPSLTTSTRSCTAPCKHAFGVTIL